MAVANGGTSFLYVTGHDRGLITNVVHFLQSQPYCAVVMTKTPVEGAFTLEDVRIQSADAPDIVVALRWKTNPSANGTPGMLTIDAKDYRPGQGSHGSLSPYDLHNTCIAAGPDFKKGMNDELPSGNIDIVPTILAVLGVEPAGRLSGRVLRETLVRTSGSVPTMTPHRLDASYRGADFTWHQYLNYSEVEGVIYLDEGSGEQQPLRK